MTTPSPAATAPTSTVSNAPPVASNENKQSTVNIEKAESYRREGKEHYTANRYEEALHAYSQSLCYCPPNWPTRSIVLGNRAAALMMLQRFVEASVDCDAALEADPTMVKLFVRRARCQLRLGQFTAAEDTCSHVLKLPLPGKDANSSSQSRIISADQDVGMAQTDANKCLVDLRAARLLLQRIAANASIQDWQGLLGAADELLDICPQCSAAQAARVTALNRLLRWDEAKEFAEHVTTTAHISVQRLSSHPDASLPAPPTSVLRWTVSCESSGGANGSNKATTLQVNIQSVVEILLCMAPALARPYLISLKNVAVSHQCCAEVMLKVQAILTELVRRCKYGQQGEKGGDSDDSDADVKTGKDKSPSRAYHGAVKRASVVREEWKWVREELDLLQLLHKQKNAADANFKSQRYQDSAAKYSAALQVDSTAVRWNAILHSNRAAAYMSMSKFEEAVRDCHAALSKDPSYARAYVRRARAHRALHDYASAVRDYRKYLSGTPPPMDAEQVSDELAEALKAQHAKTQADTARQQREAQAAAAAQREREQRQQQQRTGRQSEDFSYDFTGSGYNRSRAPGRGWGSSTQGGRTRAPPFPSSTYGTSGAYSSGGNYPGFPSWEDDDANSDEDEDIHSRTRGMGSHSSYGARPSSSSRVPPDYRSSSSRHQTRPPPPPSEEPRSVPALYKILGISMQATESQVRKAYHALALKFHPDKNKEAGAEDTFKEIGRAYAVLSDSSQRASYDRQHVQERRRSAF